VRNRRSSSRPATRSGVDRGSWLTALNLVDFVSG
jgi:hypothetical protein